MHSVFIVLIFFLSFLIPLTTKTNEPYDNDLSGKNLICLTKSDSIDDWGIKFLSNKKVILYLLDKFIYELYEHKRFYRTDERNIKIYNGAEIDFLISRKTLRFSNKKCALTDEDPMILLKKRIQDLKDSKMRSNLL